MKVDITQRQLQAIIDMRDDMDANSGGSDTDEEWNRNIMFIDRFLKKNNLNK